jgi:type IV secretory pathway TrbF-like protein
MTNPLKTAEAEAKRKLAEAKLERVRLHHQLRSLQYKIRCLQEDVNVFRPKKLDAYGFTAEQRLVGTEEDAAAYRANRWMMG